MPFSIRSPSSINRTLWLSHVVRMSSITLTSPLCRTMYTGTGDGAGRALTSAHNAFTPPAEAPTTITGDVDLIGLYRYAFWRLGTNRNFVPRRTSFCLIGCLGDRSTVEPDR